MKTTSLFALLLLSSLASAQNLVLNGDFEQYLACPNNQGQGDLAVHWYKSVLNTNQLPSHTDYLNSCQTNPTSWGVPFNVWGNEMAHSGEGYIGLAPLWPPLGANYRENMYTQLVSPLIIGTEYEVSFYVSHADNFTYFSNNLGVQFSMNTVFPINNVSEVFEPNVVYQSNGWHKVTGRFIAQKPYTYMAIGNFFDDSQTTVTNFQGIPVHNEGSLYYIDDVEVYQVLPRTAVGLDETLAENAQFFCSPSYVVDQFNASYTLKDGTEKISIQVIAIDGKVLKQVNIGDTPENQHTINISDLPGGIYLCHLKSGNEVLCTRKIVKQ